MDESRPGSGQVIPRAPSGVSDPDDAPDGAPEDTPDGAPHVGVAAVVVTHEGPGDRLDRCLDALVAGGGLDAIVVVDNSGSTRPHLDGPCVTTLRTDNDGYGAAADAAFSHPVVRSADHVALVNDDVVVTEGWLGPLVDELERDPRVGAVQPKLLIAPSDPSGPAVVNSLGVEIDRFGAGVDVGHGLADDPADTAARDVRAVTAGAVLFRRSFLDDLDGFDHRYFLYYEDVDLCLRGSERGWRFRCAPASVVMHEMSATTSGLGDERVRLLERNRLVTAARFASPTTQARALSLSLRRLRHRPRRAHLAGAVAGVARMPTAWRERRRARGASR